MPRKPKDPTSPTEAIVQLKIRLLDISPMMWRRVLVPAAFTLRELHGVVQVAMGWESLHLYLFQIRAVAYGSFQLSLESAVVRKAIRRVVRKPWASTPLRILTRW